MQKWGTTEHSNHRGNVDEIDFRHTKKELEIIAILDGNQGSIILMMSSVADQEANSISIPPMVIASAP